MFGTELAQWENFLDKSDILKDFYTFGEFLKG